MRDRQTCIGCGKKSPETETNYTLISAQFGWRLTRYRDPEGAIVIEWRCPACWRDYKKAKGDGPAGPGGPAESGSMRRSPSDAPETGRPPSRLNSPSVPPTPRVAPPSTPLPPKTGRSR